MLGFTTLDSCPRSHSHQGQRGPQAPNHCLTPTFLLIPQTQACQRSCPQGAPMPELKVGQRHYFSCWSACFQTSWASGHTLQPWMLSVTTMSASPPFKLSPHPDTSIPVVRQEAIAEHEPAALVALQVVGPLEKPALEAVQGK